MDLEKLQTIARLLSELTLPINSDQNASEQDISDRDQLDQASSIVQTMHNRRNPNY